MANDLASVKTLLVDLDGTLLGARNLFLRFDFIRKTLRALVPQGSWFRAFRGLKAMDRVYKEEDASLNLASLAEAPTNYNRAIQVFSNEFRVSIERAEQILASVMTFVFPKLERHFYPMPGAQKFLEWAKDRYRLVLATNPVWPEEIIKMRLKWAGVDPSLFSLITHAGIMHAAKPYPNYYREVLQQISCGPGECMLIGNEIKMDLPAVQVGLPVYIVIPPSTKEKPLVVDTVPEAARYGSSAKAWKGSFAALQKMLEEAHAGR
ncbi:HAD family hydrolase [bacterium]|nr:HAD family hydrolase [bacterium]